MPGSRVSYAHVRGIKKRRINRVFLLFPPRASRHVRSSSIPRWQDPTPDSAGTLFTKRARRTRLPYNMLCRQISTSFRKTRNYQAGRSTRPAVLGVSFILLFTLRRKSSAGSQQNGL